MDAFLIVIAILSAVVLLFRCAVPPRKLKHSACELLSEKAMLYRIEMLAKRCSSVRRGFGVYYREVKLDKLLNDIGKKPEWEEWERALLYNRADILYAFKKGQSAMRLSYTLGAVNGYPRLYLLCDDIVKYTEGNIDASTLNKAVAIFDKYAPLVEAERAELADMLRFCLCRLVYDVTVTLQKRNAEFRSGVSDGNVGKVDLDSIENCDYVCGLYDTAPGKEKRAVERVLETNGISREQAELSRRLFVSKFAAIIGSATRSLIMLKCYALVGEQNDAVKKQKSLSPTVIKVLSVAPVVLSVLTAVLVCIFVPARNAAIVAVVSLIFYALFRLPVLLHTPNHTSEYRLRVEAFFKKLAKKKESAITLPARAPSEIAYFGGEAELIENVLRGKNISVKADNRGKVTIITSHGEYELKVFCSVDGEKVCLDECDGVFDKHTSIYNIVKNGVELHVKLIAAIDCDCCCANIFVVNRTPNRKKVKLSVLLIPYAIAAHETCERLQNCVAVTGGERISALACENAVYNTDLRGVESAIHECGITALVGEVVSTLGGFERMQNRASVIFATTTREAERLAELTLEKQYLPHAEIAARTFCDNNEIYAVDTRCGYGTENDIEEKVAYTPLDCDIGYSNDGTYTFDPTAEQIIVSRNTVCTEDCGVELSEEGVQELFWQGDKITAERGVFDSLARAFIIINDCGIMWSPTRAPFGNGNFRVRHGLGYTEYICGYNDSISSLKIYVANGRGVLFDISVENKRKTARDLEIMFSLLLSQKFSASVQNNVPIATFGKTNIAVLCSEEICAAACRKEGYFTRGKIARTSAFRAGGTTPAPTVGAHMNIKPHGKKRIVFAIADINEIETVSTAFADKCFGAVVENSERFGMIDLHSTDKLLNFVYKRALYKAFTDGFVRRSCSERDSAVVCTAAKYVDATAVKNRLTELLCDLTDDASKLYTAVAVMDYAEFSQDYGFLDKRISREVGRNCKSVTTIETVSDRCFGFAVSALMYEPSRDIVKQAVHYRQIIDVLRYFGNKSRNADIVRNGLSHAAYLYSQKLKAAKYIVCKSDDVFDVLEYALLLFRSGDYGGAYGALKRCSRTVLNECEHSAAACALFYTLITEQLAGIAFVGERARIFPRLAKHIPELAFDINTGHGKAHIVVDNSVPTGDWIMRTGNISYTTGNIKLSNRDEKTINFCRNGCEDS